MCSTFHDNLYITTISCYSDTDISYEVDVIIFCKEISLLVQHILILNILIINVDMY